MEKAIEAIKQGRILWAAFGKWEWSRVKDILVESPKRVIWEACKEALHWEGRGDFLQKRDLVDHLYLRTVEEGWELGRGPGGRPYNECSPSELMGQPRWNRTPQAWTPTNGMKSTPAEPVDKVSQ